MKSFFSLLLICNSVLNVLATNYYISPYGNDADNGNLSSPWKSLNYAAQLLAAGDTLFILPGIYNEFCTITQQANEQSPIVITTQKGEEKQAIIDGTGVTILYEGYEESNGGLIQIVGSSNIKVSNLVIKNSHKEGILAWNSDGITFSDLEVLNTASSGIAAWNCSNVEVVNSTVENACQSELHEFITIAGTQNFSVSRCTLKNTSDVSHKEGIDIKDGSTNGKVFYNRVSDLAAAGIYLDAWTELTGNVEVYNNLVENCNGIALASEGGGKLYDVFIYNNICINNYNYGIVLGNWGDITDVTSRPISNVQIFHNTILNNGKSADWGGGISLENRYLEDIYIYNNIISGNKSFQINNESNLQVSDIEFDANLVFGESSYSTELSSTYRFMEDPMLEGEDLPVEPSDNSPAIDAATTLSYHMPFDYHWNNRMIDGDNDSEKRNDLGAIEFQAESANPTTLKQHNLLDIALYPNPFNGKVRIDLKIETMELVVYDLAGQLIYKGNDAEIDTQDWPAGVYLFTINTVQHSVTQKLIKH